MKVAKLGARTRNISLAMTDITCVLNAHRESHLVYPSIRSVLRAREAARRCHLDVDILVTLDLPCAETEEIVSRELESEGSIRRYTFGDLALSRNQAVQDAKGRYVAFIDGDDLWSEHWLVDSYMLARGRPEPIVLHPEYNVYFGVNPHVLKHVDMESPEFELEYFLRQNYWTALSFARRDLYLAFPYRQNTIADGFGYEDWTWNYETIRHGVVHKVVPGTAHFIRRGKSEPSLLDQTNSHGAIPRILKTYHHEPDRPALREAV